VGRTKGDVNGSKDKKNLGVTQKKKIDTAKMRKMEED